MAALILIAVKILISLGIKFLKVAVIFLSLDGYAQCGSSNNIGVTNVCDINSSRTANLNIVNTDSIITGSWFANPIAVLYGGTGATTITGALNNLLPTQTGGSGKVLTSNGTDATWVTPSVGTVTNVAFSSSDLTVTGTPVTATGTITANLTTTGVSAGTYIIATVDTKGRVTAARNPTIDTISSSRSFNVAYKMSDNDYVDIRLAFSVTCALTLGGGQAGEVYLEISANGSSGWINRGQIPFSNTGTLVIGVAITQINGGSLSTMVPPTYYWRLRTNNTTGSPTYTLYPGTKITY